MKKHNKIEQGQSLVEMAFSFVLLMLILAGLVDFGRAFFSYISIYDGAREGSIFASNFSGDKNLISNHIRATSTDPIDLLEDARVHITINDYDFNPGTIFPCAGDSIEVIIKYDFNFTMPFVNLFIGTNDLPLIAKAISTVLSPACY